MKSTVTSGNIKSQVEQDIITILKSHVVARIFPVLKTSEFEQIADRNQLGLGIGRDGYVYMYKGTM